MNKIELLFNLIKSFTKSEKRYFKLLTQMHSGEKGFVILYELLDESKHFDESLKIKLKNVFKGDSIEPARKYLYKLLMKSLRLFEEENNVENKLSNLVNDCKILFAKGHLKLYEEQLEKAQKMALKYEKYTYFQILARLELQNLVRSQFNNLDENQLIQKQTQLKEIIKHELLLHEHASLYEILLFRYLRNGIVRSKEGKDKLNDLLLEETQILQKSRLKSFESQKLHLNFQSAYFMMIGSHKGSLQVYYELNDLFRKNPELWSDNPINYIYVLDGILTDLTEMERLSDIDFFLEALATIALEFKNVSAVGKTLHFIHRINQLIAQKEIEKAVIFWNDSVEDIKKMTQQLPSGLQVEFRFANARLLYFAKKYSLALKEVNFIFDEYLKVLSASQYSECRILNLMIHYELRNFDYLTYALQSLERKLKLEKRFYAIEQFIIKVFRNILNDKKLSIRLQKEYKSIAENPYNQSIIRKLSLNKWVDLHLKI
ncbi:MAG: hypothetical protein ACK4NY_15110 [Spirosomataceae bacterium]